MTTCSIFPIVDVLERSPVLLERSGAKLIRERVEEELSSVVRGGYILTLDFSGIEYLNWSAIDELVSKLISRLVANEFGSDKYLILKNDNLEQMKTIHVALTSSGGAVIAHDSSNCWACLGQISGRRFQALQTLMCRRKLTSSQLSELIPGLESVSNPARNATMYLNALNKARLARREKNAFLTGGIQYTYFALLQVNKQIPDFSQN